MVDDVHEVVLLAQVVVSKVGVIVDMSEAIGIVKTKLDGYAAFEYRLVSCHNRCVF